MFIALILFCLDRLINTRLFILDEAMLVKIPSDLISVKRLGSVVMTLLTFFCFSVLSFLALMMIALNSCSNRAYKTSKKYQQGGINLSLRIGMYLTKSLREQNFGQSHFILNCSNRGS